MKKFLSGLKLVWAYWISALTVELFFRASKILELVPIIERDIIIGIIFIGMYVYSSTIVVACDGIKKSKIAISVLSVQFIIATLMSGFGRNNIIYIISTPISMGNYVFYENCNKYEPVRTIEYFVLSLLVTYVPIFIGNAIHSAIDKKLKQSS